MNRAAILSDDLDRNLNREDALALVDCDLASLLRVAARRRDGAHGSIVSYSRKVFIPLTKLCRDVCHYCTFAQPPRENERAYLSLDEARVMPRAARRHCSRSATSRSCATEAPPMSSLGSDIARPCRIWRRPRARSTSKPDCFHTS